MKEYALKKVNEMWSEVLAEEKLPTLMLLEFMPENIWCSEITNFNLTMENEDRDDMKVFAFGSKFYWVLNGEPFRVDASIVINKANELKKDNFQFFSRQYNFYRNGKKVDGHDFAKIAFGGSHVTKDFSRTIIILLKSLHLKVYKLYKEELKEGM